MTATFGDEVWEGKRAEITLTGTICHVSKDRSRIRFVDDASAEELVFNASDGIEVKSEREPVE